MQLYSYESPHDKNFVDHIIWKVLISGPVFLQEVQWRRSCCHRNAIRERVYIPAFTFYTPTP